MVMELASFKGIKVVQQKEWGELLGFETRNKYEITTLEGEPVGLAAEEAGGFFGFLLRQFFGHWRRFKIHIYDSDRNLVLTGLHPFRLFFSRLEVRVPSGKLIGVMQRRFSIHSKRFDLQDAQGRVILSVSSPLWKLWTFEFKTFSGQRMATIEKKWGGILKEACLDADNFELLFHSSKLSEECKKTLLMSTIFVDLMFFETKAR